MRTTLTSLKTMRAAGERIAMLTCYDASFATLLEAAGLDVLLVGDSLGMVMQGLESTLPVTLDDMVYHTSCVARGAAQSFIVSDMPFGTSQISPEKTFEHAAHLMAAGAQMVKLEGGAVMLETVHFLTSRGIPVCAHIGLTPQSVHQLGGYKVQGREAAQLTIPTIGIGAGASCSGQVLVLYDMLDIYPGKKARFVKNYMQGADGIAAAVSRYVAEVKNGSFPAMEHGF
ncbi:MAG: 3-methyl-2-oxobutanoate hydroxymethyltransferase [Proteobacteria bacterium]|nr:3-methyl-2-oxobutanoate hydroxymethyltransferase [Pseudomonadota bacterium]